MSKKLDEDWYGRHRFAVFALFMLIVWGSIFSLLYLKADEITKNPCQVCAKKMGEKVSCVVGETYLTKRTFHPNFSIQDDVPEVYYVEKERYEINYSKLIVNKT